MGSTYTLGLPEDISQRAEVMEILAVRLHKLSQDFRSALPFYQFGYFAKFGNFCGAGSYSKAASF